MVVGCAGVASADSSLTIAAPTGMSQAWALGASNHEFADAPQAAAGPTGARAWRFASKAHWSGWLAVLRPS